MCAAPMEMITVGGQRAGGDVLGQWADGLRRQKAEPECGLLRFAFYGRVSTEDWQDPESSRARQLAQAVMLVAGRGVIAAVFFDAGTAGRWRGRGARRPPPSWPRSRTRTGGGTRS